MTTLLASRWMYLVFALGLLVATMPVWRPWIFGFNPTLDDLKLGADLRRVAYARRHDGPLIDCSKEQWIDPPLTRAALDREWVSHPIESVIGKDERSSRGCS